MQSNGSYSLNAAGGSVSVFINMTGETVTCGQNGSATMTFSISVPSGNYWVVTPTPTANSGYKYIETKTGGSADYMTGSWYRIYSSSSSASLSFYFDIQPYEFSGDGTASSPYLIQTEDDLRGMSKNVNSGVDTSAYFLQTADIYMSSENFDSIGTSTYKFSGNYDGNNKVIYNLTTNGMGMFGYFYLQMYGQIKNVILKGLTINSTATSVGGLIGEYTQVGSRGLPISNCSIEGYINASGTYVGGLVGSSGTSDIRAFENCVFEGIIEGSGKNVGGMVGGVVGNYAPNTHNCHVNAMISSTNSTGNVGGLFGLLDYSGPGPSNATVEGIIKGEYNVGGLFGYVASNAPNASNMAVKAQIIAKTPSRAGAFIGESAKANCLSNCSFIGSSNIEIGLFTGSVSTGKITSGACYSQVNNRKSYTAGTYTGYTVVPNMNNDLPMQNALFSVAIGGQTSDYVVNHLKSKGFTLVS